MRRPSTAFGLALLLTLPLLAPGAPAKPEAAAKTDWPLFRANPGQTGVAGAALPAKLEVLWTFKTGDPIEGSVAVAGGVVYLPSMDEHLYAIDLLTGRAKWRYKSAPFKAAPVVRKDLVYAGDVDGGFHCVGAAKGDKKWVFDAGGEIGGANFFGDSILVSSHDEHLYCLTMEGKQSWKFKTDGPVYGAPAVADGKTFLVGCDSQLHVIDVAKGKELSSTALGGQTAATAAVVGDQLFVGTMKNEVRAIDWKKGAATWTFKPTRRQAFYASAAVNEKLVVIGCRDGRVYALSRAGGKEEWSFPTGNKVDSSPVIAGSRVVAGSLDRNLYVLDLASGKELQRLGLDGPVLASPVVVDGKVLIGTQKGTLYCLGAKK
jgi:outer membrane protein assembly factor BamB